MKMLILALFFLTGCGIGNKVEVPNRVEQCFKDPKTGECTNQVNVTVNHIITIALPDAFTDECKRKWNETDYPDKDIRDAGYNACIRDYIDQITSILGGLNPTDLPPVSP